MQTGGQVLFTSIDQNPVRNFSTNYTNNTGKYMLVLISITYQVTVAGGSAYVLAIMELRR